MEYVISARRRSQLNRPHVAANSLGVGCSVTPPTSSQLSSRIRATWRLDEHHNGSLSFVLSIEVGMPSPHEHRTTFSSQECFTSTSNSACSMRAPALRRSTSFCVAYRCIKLTRVRPSYMKPEEGSKRCWGSLN